MDKPCDASNQVRRLRKNPLQTPYLLRRETNVKRIPVVESGNHKGMDGVAVTLGVTERETGNSSHNKVDGCAGEKISPWSNATPRSQTVVEKARRKNSMVTAPRSGLASCFRAPSQMNWVLGGLSRKRFDDIQAVAPFMARNATTSLSQDGMGSLIRLNVANSISIRRRKTHSVFYHANCSTVHHVS